MGTPYHAPHVEGATPAKTPAPNAALLIDFDNVTMGMRSDLSKELKNLLQTDVIRGKVTVQRAYADWRRYPQYIVPLSENSVDLIFAPAYGSSKKNATDIRMAIDAMEIIFVRPEIGTFILLTGDSDFSSLVLKLKEYGKYVIGVGIQESSSDILVQNCDEYYSYTSLSGLSKTSDSSGKAMDPWSLTEQAVKKMVKRDDVMRSDRLKQVMMEIDPSFDEGNFGFSKFSKFVSEAASRKLVRLQKLDNGQYEIIPGSTRGGGGRSRNDSGRSDSGRSDSGRGRGRGRDDSRGRKGRGRSDRGQSSSDERGGARSEEKHVPSIASHDEPLEAAYKLLAKALEEHAANGRDPVRDSDVKRKMLEIRGAFDEGELGFSKFSKFLQQAREHGLIRVEVLEGGNQMVSLAQGKSSDDDRLSPEPGSEPERQESRWELVSGKGTRSFDDSDDDDAHSDESSGASSEAAVEPEPTGVGGRIGVRGGARGSRDPGQITLLEGQIIGPTGGRGSDGGLDLEALGLPRDEESIVQYLANSYKGVGEKTAEQIVEEFGTDVFRVMQEQPERIRNVVPRTADQVIDNWASDYARRSGSDNGGAASTGDESPAESHRDSSGQGSSYSQPRSDAAPDTVVKTAPEPQPESEPEPEPEPEEEEEESTGAFGGLFGRRKRGRFGR